MALYKLPNDSVHWYINELTSRIVAQSGIPTDRYHLGKMILQSLKDAPDFILQLNGATGVSESNGSVLNRSVRCAISLHNMGLRTGDVMVLMAPNHNDLIIPFYAALYLGIAVEGVDRTLRVLELEQTFAASRPKVVFCQSERATDVQLALNNLDLSSHIITFDRGDNLFSYQEFLDKYGDESVVEEFKPTDFNAEETLALLITTSGTTGLPKCTAATHRNFAISAPYLWGRHSNFPSPTRMALIASPIQWLTALINIIILPIIRVTLLMSYKPMNQEHMYELINTYRPTFVILSPTLVTILMKPDDREYRDRCDFTSFEQILIGGSAVPQELVNELKAIAPNAYIVNTYGMSELNGPAFHGVPSPPGSCGKPLGCFFYRIVNVDTQEDILEPNVAGELWIKGPGLFKEYYNNPEATAESYAENGWFKTGDMFYRDENWNYFFVERLKLLLKYKIHQISPIEIELLIRQHPSVLDVAVTSVPDPECGDLPIACVVAKTGCRVSKQEIKDLVRENLADSKQLRGGVIFMSELPLTASTKVHRRKLKEMVLHMDRE